MEDRGSLSVVAVGELDIVCVGGLRGVLADARRLAPAPAVVLDLSRVEMLDTEVLSVLVAERDELRSRGSDLWLVAPPGLPARRIFEITGEDRRFRFFDDRESAARSRREHRPVPA
jgi:anti-anti-sigma factor